MINAVFGKSCSDGGSAIENMISHKAETALRFFETDVDWSLPDYVAQAIR